MNLQNKTILFLGSSVTYGSAAGGISFVDIIQDLSRSICIKEAVSGTTLADINERSYVSRLKAIDADKHIDLFVCQLSTNDATRKIELSKIEEAIRYILDYVKTTFNCPIVFYTGTIYKSEEYERMIDLLYDLKREYSFEILDLFNDEQMLKISQEDYKKYMQDPIHPNLLGYKEWWTPKFLDFFEQL
jgi:lysophospholipase L1-like esterase